MVKKYFQKIVKILKNVVENLLKVAKSSLLGPTQCALWEQRGVRGDLSIHPSVPSVRPRVPVPDPRSPGLSPQMSRSQCPIVPVPQSGLFFQKTLHFQEGENTFFSGNVFFYQKKAPAARTRMGKMHFFLGTSFFTTKKAPAAHTRSGCKTLEKSGQNTKSVLMIFFFH